MRRPTLSSCVRRRPRLDLARRDARPCSCRLHLLLNPEDLRGRGASPRPSRDTPARSNLRSASTGDAGIAGHGRGSRTASGGKSTRPMDSRSSGSSFSGGAIRTSSTESAPISPARSRATVGRSRSPKEMHLQMSATMNREVAYLAELLEELALRTARKPRLTQPPPWHPNTW